MGTGAGSRRDRVLTGTGHARKPRAAVLALNVGANTPNGARPVLDREIRRNFAVARPARNAQGPHHRQARVLPQCYRPKREPEVAEGPNPVDCRRPLRPAIRKQDVAQHRHTRIWRNASGGNRPGLCGGGQARARRRTNADRMGNGQQLKTGARRAHRPRRTGDVRLRAATLPTSGSGTDPAARTDDCRRSPARRENGHDDRTTSCSVGQDQPVLAERTTVPPQQKNSVGTSVGQRSRRC